MQWREVLLKNALSDKINDREIYMKGIDRRYYSAGEINERGM